MWTWWCHRQVTDGGDERRSKGEEREKKQDGVVDQTDSHLCLLKLSDGSTQTHTHTLSLSVTYGPHVDQASAQERVQAPLYAGQAGDVEDLVPQACREQEEEVQQPVPHFILRLATALEEI